MATARKPNNGFKKGQSGNPKGRPPAGLTFAERMRAYLDHPYQGGGTRYDKVIREAFKAAEEGDLNAIKFIVERLDGKVPDKVETKDTTELSPEERNAARDNARRKLGGAVQGSDAGSAV